MSERARRVLVACILSGLCAFPLESGAQNRRMAPATQAEEAQIYLIRDTSGAAAGGMERLARDLKKQGYTDVGLWSWTDVDAIVHDIATGRHRGDDVHVVLIGRSPGADAVLQVAEKLAPAGIEIDLAVTIDLGAEAAVPPNVGALVNFYQENGFGRRAIAAEGFKGRLSNIDLSDQGVAGLQQVEARLLEHVGQLVHRHIQSEEIRRRSGPRG